MSDNKEYWSKLLGDSFDEDLFNSILNTPDDETPPSAANTPAQPPATNAPAQPREAKPASAGYDTLKFVDFDISAPKDVPELRARPTREQPAQDRNDIGSKDFDVDFDFDSEYRDVPSDRPLHVRRHRRTGCLGGILYAAFIICVSLVLAALLWMASTDVLALGKPDGTLTVTVPANYTIDGVCDILHEDGMIKYKALFKLYCKFSHAEEDIVSGSYTLNTNYDYRAIVIGLTPATGKRLEVDVTVPEGYNLIQIFDLLVEKEVCTADELWDAAANHEFEYAFLDSTTLGDKYRLEGYMFPDTYTFYVDDKPSRVINKFLANFEKKFTEEYTSRAAELGYTVKEVLTIASMIEREAAFDAERDAIASVIYNRLNSSSFSCLQIDATIYYGIARDGGTADDFSTDYDTPYNTYMYEGLPPGPISNPGIESIRGALYPQDTSNYYYALSVDGGHEFFTNYNSFINFVNSDKFDDGTR